MLTQTISNSAEQQAMQEVEAAFGSLYLNIFKIAALAVLVLGPVVLALNIRNSKKLSEALRLWIPIAIIFCWGGILAYLRGNVFFLVFALAYAAGTLRRSR